MVYYYNFWNFYLIFILFILLLLLLLPNYIKKDIVPPLSEANYIIQNPTGNFNILNSQATTFSDLIFEDGVEGGTCALDFGSSGGDTSTISYIPYYSESHKPLTGYFDLNIGTSLENTLAFRVVDKKHITWFNFVFIQLWLVYFKNNKDSFRLYANLQC